MVLLSLEKGWRGGREGKFSQSVVCRESFFKSQGHQFLRQHVLKATQRRVPGRKWGGGGGVLILLQSFRARAAADALHIRGCTSADQQAQWHTHRHSCRSDRLRPRVKPDVYGYLKHLAWAGPVLGSRSIVVIKAFCGRGEGGKRYC